MKAARNLVVRMAMLSLLASLLVISSAALASAKHDFTVTIGQDKVFTQYNIHNTNFADDPNTGLDWPGNQIIKACLDQKAPIAEISITGVTRNGGPIEEAEPCGKFQVGDVIHGGYKVEDQNAHFRVLTLGVRPGGAGWPSFGATPNPSIRSYPIVPAIGESGTWTLDTAGMAPCGYVVHLWTEDRTIVNGGYIGWGNSADVGFCLEAPPSAP